MQPRFEGNRPRASHPSCKRRQQDVVPVRVALHQVSASEAGDYCQVLFQDEGGSDRAYVLLQRQFEDSDDGTCYLETHDPDYVGHFRVRHARLAGTCFSIELRRKSRARLDVSFRTIVDGYPEVARILKIMIPAVDLIPGADAC